MKQDISEHVMKKAIGCPRKFSPSIRCQLLRQFSKLVRDEAHFTVKRLMKQAGLNNKEVSIRTVQRSLHSKEYKYLQVRQKGLLTESDLRKRFKFAKKMKEYNDNVWTEKIALVLDAVSFIHKFNPTDQAHMPRWCIWRKEREGLSYRCTARASHCSSGRRVAKFAIAIT